MTMRLKASCDLEEAATLGTVLLKREDAQEGRASDRRILVLLTGFGGHEQMLLKHLQQSNLQWQVFVVSEKLAFIHKLTRELPLNCSIVDTALLPAYPSAKRIGTLLTVFHGWKILRRFGAEFDLISNGEISNFAYLQAIARLVKINAVAYVPMAPRTSTWSVRLGRWATRFLLTISQKQAFAFVPPANAVLLNTPLGHLARLPTQRPSPDEFAIYWVGRFEAEQKSPATAIEILAKARALSGLPLVLNFVGDGPELGVLQDVAKQLLVAESVRFWGWVDFSRDDLCAMPPIDLLLNTSHYEGVPLTAIDALSLGVSCLARKNILSAEIENENIFEWATVDEAAAIVSAIAKKRAPLPHAES